MWRLDVGVVAYSIGQSFLKMVSEPTRSVNSDYMVNLKLGIQFHNGSLAMEFHGFFRPAVVGVGMKLGSKLIEFMIFFFYGVSGSMRRSDASELVVVRSCEERMIEMVVYWFN